MVSMTSPGRQTTITRSREGGRTTHASLWSTTDTVVNVLRSSMKACCDVSLPLSPPLLPFSPFRRSLSKQNMRLSEHEDHRPITRLSAYPCGRMAAGALFYFPQAKAAGQAGSRRLVMSRRRRRRRGTSDTMRGARLKAKVSPNVPERESLSLMDVAMDGAIDRRGQ